MKQIFYTRRNAGTRCASGGLSLPSRLGKRRELPQRDPGQYPGYKRILGILWRQKASGKEKM